MPPPDSFFYDEYHRRPARLSRAALGAAAVAAALILLIGLLEWRQPAEFPTRSYLAISTGESLSSVAARLAGEKLIRSPFWFKCWSVLLGGTRGVKAGDYYFPHSLSLPRVAWRLTHADFALVPLKVLIPEGTSLRQMGALLQKILPHFSLTKFMNVARGKEGYLFPDTYFFLPDTTEEKVVSAMEINFAKQIKRVAGEIALSRRPLKDIIIMASFLEEEARTTETRQKVAGILWKRLDRDMLLQVDAVFPYIFGDKPYNLTDGDLLVDSPYNTYKYKGLPPAPITNPGLDAIRAAVTPIVTAYWFYLSDKEGMMHYARTHEEHQANRERYLNQ